MIFKERQTLLFYNTISGQNFKICSTPFLLSVIEKLQDIKNGYCIELSESELNILEMKEFIQLLRNTFCGDWIAQELTTMRPFSLYPMPSVMKNRDVLKSNPYLSLGEKLLNFLHVLTIQITGICDLRCDNCLNTYRQTISCRYSGNELEFECIEKILDQISGSDICSINIIGGDVFHYRNWNKLMLLLHQYPFLYDLYTDYRHLSCNEAKVEDIQSLNHSIIVIIPPEFDQDILIKALQMISNMNFELIFHVSSEAQFIAADTFRENHKIDNYTFVPVYLKTNLDFFRDFIFLREESILASPVSRRTIFTNMKLNSLDFGKLTILSNGDIHANLNFPELGNVKTDSIREMIYRELEQGESWFRVRVQKPCSDCMYQWLCPPPSYYEIATGKPNLCHVK